MADTIKGKLVIDTQVQIDSARKQLSDLQKYLDKLTIPTNLKDRFTTTFSSLNKEFSKLETKMQGSLKTKGDLSGIEKTTQAIERLYENLTNLTAKTGSIGDSIFGKIQTAEIDNLDAKIKQISETLKNFTNVPSLQKLKTDFENSATASDTLKTKVEAFVQAFKAGDFSGAEKIRNEIAKTAKGYETLKTNTGQVSEKQKAWIDALTSVDKATQEYNNTVTTLNQQLSNLTGQREQAVEDALNKQRNGFEQVSQSVKNGNTVLRENNNTLIESVRSMVSFETQAQSVASSLTRIFSVTGAISAFRKIIRDAFNDVKELDEAMTSIAVVTDFSIGDLWNQVDKYSKLAQEKGVELKGVYDVQKLYYQQGRNAEDVSVLTNNTLEFARIAEMDYAAATDAMTVAVNAFNLKAKDSIKIVDIYSNLAAKAAVDQSELANAMSKVASMAASVGMSLETTSTFLTQIIETTREAPETAGTALKTVLARFGEVKKLIDTGKSTGTTDEGEEVDVNKIDTALKTVGVRLTDTNGQMRALDKVILELAEKWNSLDSMTQRYLATMAAGSRQQSRFLALMSNSERLTELLGEAYNSAGAGAAQFAKTQESLQSKINNLKTAWTQFTTSVLDSDLLKGAVDTLTLLLNTVNALTDALGPLSGAAKIAAISFTLIGGGQKIEKLFSGKLASGLVKAGELFRTGKINGEEYQAGFESGRNGTEAVNNAKRSLKDIVEAQVQGTKEGVAAAQAREISEDEIEDLYQAYGATEDVAKAYIQGQREGAALAQGKIQAEEAFSTLSLPKRMAAEFLYGKQIGGSWIKGFESAFAVFKASAIFAPLVAVFSTLAFGAAIAAIAYFSSETYKLKKEAKQFQKELEDIQTQKNEYDNEISQLKANEQLTIQEKKRLEVLEKQSEELEKQEKLKKRQIFENEVKQKEENLSRTTYSTQRIRGQEVNTPTTVYYEDYDSYIVALQEDIANAEKEIRGLGGSDADQEQVDKLKAKIEGWKNDLSNIYQLFFDNLDVLNDEELKTMFSAGHSSGVDSETLLGLGAGDAYQQLLQLRDAGKLTSTAIENLANNNNQLRIFLDSTKVSAQDLARELNNVSQEAIKASKVQGYKDAAAELKSIKTSVSAITDAISGIYKDGYADIEKISTIANNEAFAKLDSFPEYLDLISSAGKEDIPQLERATETLLEEYMNSENVINSLNEATAGLYINALNNMGVINAQEVVSEKLSIAQERQKFTTLDLAEAMTVLTSDEEEVIYQADILASKFGSTREAMARYVLQQKVLEANPLDLTESIGALTAVAKTAGMAQASLMTLAQYQNKINLRADEIQQMGFATAQEAEAELERYKASLGQEYLDKIKAFLKETSTVKIETDFSQFNKTSSKSEKEIQKLSELYNAKKRVAELDEKISDLEEARKTLTNYDERLANENAIIEAYRQQKVGLEELIKANETLRARKEAEGKTTAQWSDFYTIDKITKELKLTDTYYQAIKKGTAENKKYSVDILNNFKKWAEEYDDIVDFGREEQNNLDKIKTTLDELWKDYRSNYIDLINELAQYYEDAQQKIIDDQKDAYDKMKELDDNYLDELRKNIEARRAARDRENDVEDITKKQKRLAMLMRDTSGRNAGEIADLQKEIQDAQQDIIDDDVDRVLDSIEDANDKQQENWDNAIDVLEKQLDADKENGKFIRMAEEKFAEGPAAVRKEFEQLFTKEGIYSQAEINSKLEDVDKKLDTAMEYFRGNDIREDVGSTGSGAGGKYTTVRYIDPEGNSRIGYVSSDNKTYKDKDLTERIDVGSIVPGSNGKAWKLNNSSGVGEEYNLTEDEKRKLGISSSGKSNTSTNTNTKIDSIKTEDISTSTRAKVSNTGGQGVWLKKNMDGKTSSRIRAYPEGTTVTVLDDSNSKWWKVNCQGQVGYIYSQYLKKFAKGGLVDFTGPAWVDGTSSNPEAFLNAQDTRNFTELKQILSSLLRADRFAGFDLSNLPGGDCNIYVTVDQIASDYDVDEAVARIKEEIMSGSSYRNINLVNRRR